MKHEFWATVSGNTKSNLESQIEDLVAWGVKAIEFRVDLMPENLWDFIFGLQEVKVPWWVAHFGTDGASEEARLTIQESVKSRATGVIFHSRYESAEEAAELCRQAGKKFIAPYHSQTPITEDQAMEEFGYQERLRPTFRKIGIRAHSYDEAAGIVSATRRAVAAGGSPIASAVFGTQRWARVALPFAGSVITFIVAHQVRNKFDGDDQQFHFKELEHLMAVKDLFPAKPH